MSSADVFISYAKPDGDWARWISGTLEHAGYSTIYYERDFKAGQNFVSRMHAALAKCRLFIAVVSDHYLASDYCTAEWTALVGQDPLNKTERLVPILIDTVNEAGILGPFVHLDLRETTEENSRASLLGRFPPRAQPGEGGISSIPPFPRDISLLGVGRRREAAEELAALQMERLSLEAGGQDTAEVIERIKALKRELREGRHLQAGEWLDNRYQLRALIGDGGFATVWHAFDAKARRNVAVKVLHGHHLADASRVERFFRGARYMSPAPGRLDNSSPATESAAQISRNRGLHVYRTR